MFFGHVYFPFDLPISISLLLIYIDVVMDKRQTYFQV